MEATGGDEDGRRLVREYVQLCMWLCFAKCGFADRLGVGACKYCVRTVFA